MCPENSFDELLNMVEMNHQLACDPEAGGCGKLNYIHHILSSPPHVFTTGEFSFVNWFCLSKQLTAIIVSDVYLTLLSIVMGWQNTCESVNDIMGTLAALSTEIDISVMYRGLDPQNKHRLVSVVRICKSLYMCFSPSIPLQAPWIGFLYLQQVKIVYSIVILSIWLLN